MKKWLRTQPDQPTTLDRTAATPRQLRDRVQPPPTAPIASPPGNPGDRLRPHDPKPRPTGDRSTDTHDRTRHDVVTSAGNVTLAIAGQLRHIGVGRTYARTRVILLVHDLHVRVVNAATGELLRDLIVDPSKDYQPKNLTPNDKQPNLPSQVRLSGMS